MPVCGDSTLHEKSDFLKSTGQLTALLYSLNLLSSSQQLDTLSSPSIVTVHFSSGEISLKRKTKEKRSFKNFYESTEFVPRFFQFLSFRVSMQPLSFVYWCSYSFVEHLASFSFHLQKQLKRRERQTCDATLNQRLAVDFFFSNYTRFLTII